MQENADDVVEQITVKSKSGTRTRLDAIGIDKETGEILIEEYITSPTASLTKNQKVAHPEIERDGSIVVGKGKPTFVGRTEKAPTKIKIIRKNRGEIMSIIDKDKIDSIGINKENGNVMIAISDHLDWSNEYEHLIMLQDKLNSYLSFIESGEIYESYSKAKDKDIEIIIYAKYDITEKAKEFLNVAYNRIVEAGFSLSCEVVGESIKTSIQK